MIIVISPAKKLDFKSEITPDLVPSEPKFLQQSESLINALTDYSADGLAQLMKISPTLAELNVNRYKQWHLPDTPERQALFAFRGDVYRGIDADNLTAKEQEYASNHLRILSGMYGILQSTDKIKPHRLEMGTKLQVNGAKNLYEYWQEQVTSYINQLQRAVLINLASVEYFNVVNSKILNLPIITPIFQQKKGDKISTIAIHAKRARGLMVRFCCQNNVTEPNLLKSFAEEGYRYEENHSTPQKWVFIREAS